jgi:hypothetical protein
MNIDYLVTLPFAKLDGWGRECHAILHSISPLAGEVRIEVSAEAHAGYSPIHLRVFDEACGCVVPVPELIEEIGKAVDRVLELTRHDPDHVTFHFSDPDSAMLFKLANGGAA